MYEDEYAKNRRTRYATDIQPLFLIFFLAEAGIVLNLFLNFGQT